MWGAQPGPDRSATSSRVMHPALERPAARATDWERRRFDRSAVAANAARNQEFSMGYGMDWDRGPGYVARAPLRHSPAIAEAVRTQPEMEGGLPMRGLGRPEPFEMQRSELPAKPKPQARGSCPKCERALRRWFGQFRRMCRACIAVYCSPEAFAVRLTSCFDRWVTRNTVLCFAFFEMIVALYVGFTFIKHDKVARLGMTTGNSLIPWFLSPAAVSQGRLVGGTIGAYAACRRKVTPTRWYFATLLANMAVSIIVTAPLYNCDCSCRNHIGQRGSLQCEVMESFVYGEDRARLRWFYMRRSPQRMGSRRLAPDAGDSSSSSTHFASAPWQTGMRRHASDDPVVAQACPKLFPNSAVRRVLAAYSVTPRGIRWNATMFAPDCQAFPPRSKHYSGDTNRTSYTQLKYDFRLLQSGAMPHWGGFLNCLDAHLADCLHHQWCGGIEATPENGRLTLCHYEYPMVPYVNGTEVPGVTGASAGPVRIFFMKNVERAMQSVVDEADVDEHAGRLCRFIIGAAILSFVFVNALTVPMVVVTFKFIRLHCGDHFKADNQFDVGDDLSEDDFAVDDFAVGTHEEILSRMDSRSMLSRESDGMQPPWPRQAVMHHGASLDGTGLRTPDAV